MTSNFEVFNNDTLNRIIQILLSEIQLEVIYGFLLNPLHYVYVLILTSLLLV